MIMAVITRFRLDAGLSLTPIDLLCEMVSVSILKDACFLRAFLVELERAIRLKETDP